jgi:hypothetical protein
MPNLCYQCGDRITPEKPHECWVQTKFTSQEVLPTERVTEFVYASPLRRDDGSVPHNAPPPVSPEF